jgi:hypothetical protein
LRCNPERARVPQVQQPRRRRRQPPTVLAVVSHARILSSAYLSSANRPLKDPDLEPSLGKARV